MKLYKNIFFGASLLLAFASCEKVMDKKNLSTINGDLIYNDSTLTLLNLSYIYDNNLPTWFGSTGGTISGNGSFSEEGSGESKFFEGTVDELTVTDFGTGLSTSNNWAKIRKINEFVRDVNAGTLPQYTKNKLTAEAVFFRAFRYFDLVRLYGGVPLVLEPMDPVGEAGAENFKPRNSTSETFSQIVKDLDFAIASLPGKWSSSSEWGRITKGAAAAFKGRVLLTYASPQFNPGDLKDRWQAAYDANLQAKTLLSANGFGLHTSYDNLWFSEVNNPEAVFVTGFNTKTSDQAKKNNNYDNQTRPSYLGTGGGSNQPTWNLVKAYSMKDGKKLTEQGAYTYDETHFYKNRDPRFDKTIAYNGCVWPINGNSNYRLWTYYHQLNSTTYTTSETKASGTGFYLRKAVDPNISSSNVAFSGTDWIEIRYAEVLLNLAESAVGIDRLANGQEGYGGLIDVRKRAGIEAGNDGLYGLEPGMDRSKLFDAILYERQIEFAFEGKRFWDLRRWKKIEAVLNGLKKEGRRYQLKVGSGIPTAGNFLLSRDSENIDMIYSNYLQPAIVNLDTRYAINWKPEYYFFAIPTGALNNNPSILQNNTWGGSFDPLK